MSTPVEIDLLKAIEFVLQEIYFKEFEAIDGCNQHPKGHNFYEWLYNKKLISKENNDKIQEGIKSEID